MTVEDFKNTDLSTIALIDIRETEELAVTPSPEGAINIPLSKMLDVIQAEELPKDKKIVTVCRSGGRCGLVNEYLMQHGYEADFIEGGMIALNAAQ